MKKIIIIGLSAVVAITTVVIVITKKEPTKNIENDAFYLGEQVVSMLRGEESKDVANYNQSIQDYITNIPSMLKEQYPDYVNVTELNDVYTRNYGVVNSSSVEDDDIDETEMTVEEIKAILGSDYEERINKEETTLPNDTRLQEVEGNYIVYHEDLSFNTEGEDFITLDGVTHLIKEGVLGTGYKNIIGKQDYNFTYSTHTVYKDSNTKYVDILYNSITNKNKLSIRVYFKDDIERMDVKVIEG